MLKGTTVYGQPPTYQSNALPATQHSSEPNRETIHHPSHHPNRKRTETTLRRRQPVPPILLPLSGHSIPYRTLQFTARDRRLAGPPDANAGSRLVELVACPKYSATQKAERLHYDNQRQHRGRGGLMTWQLHGAVSNAGGVWRRSIGCSGRIPGGASASPETNHRAKCFAGVWPESGESSHTHLRYASSWVSALSHTLYSTPSSRHREGGTQREDHPPSHRTPLTAPRPAGCTPAAVRAHTHARWRAR